MSDTDSVTSSDTPSTGQVNTKHRVLGRWDYVIGGLLAVTWIVSVVLVLRGL